MQKQKNLFFFKLVEKLVNIRDSNETKANLLFKFNRCASR